MVYCDIYDIIFTEYQTLDMDVSYSYVFSPNLEKKIIIGQI